MFPADGLSTSQQYVKRTRDLLDVKETAEAADSVAKVSAVYKENVTPAPNPFHFDPVPPVPFSCNKIDGDSPVPFLFSPIELNIPSPFSFPPIDLNAPTPHMQ